MNLARQWGTIGLALLLAVLVGCGSTPSDPPPPPTYPVTGKIINKGKQKLEGGMIEFVFEGQSVGNSRGEIKAGDTFTLELMLRDGKRLPGAVAGKHRVTIIPVMGADQQMVPITLDELVTVEAKENNLTLTAR